MKCFLSFIIACISFLPSQADGLFDGTTSVGFGITTFLLNGANPANQKIFPKESEGAIGGGFRIGNQGFH